MPRSQNSQNKEACLRDAAELLSSADLAMAENDQASAAELIEAAYQAYDDAAVQARPVFAPAELPEFAGAYALT